ncbi:MAG: hypothetical protein ACOH17_07760 [Cellulomonas sp.]
MTASRPRARVGVPRWHAGLVAASAAAIAVLSALALPGRFALHQCVSAGGELGALGLRLALLRNAADCPDGTVAFTPLARGGVVVLLSVAVPVLLFHLAVGAGGLGIGAVLVRALRSAAAVLAAVLPRVPRSAVVVVGRVPRFVVPFEVRAARTIAAVLAAHPHRGPPVLAA